MAAIILLLVLLCFRIECLPNSTSNSAQTNQFLSMPWLNNLVEIESPTHNGTVLGSSRNRTIEDEIITDEDVADIPDDDHHPQINTVVTEGDRTTITVSTEAGEELLQHWLDQAVSGLMATVATNKLESASDKEKKAHRTCTKTAKTVAAHAKCVSALLHNSKSGSTQPQKHAMKVKISLAKARMSSKSSSVASERRSRKKLRKMRTRKANVSSRQDGTLRWSSAERRLKLRQTKGRLQRAGPRRIRFNENLYKQRTKAKIDFRRMKRDIAGFKPVTKNSYTMTNIRQKSPFAVIAKQLTNAIRSFKRKDRNTKSWQETLKEISEEGKRLKKKEKFKKLFKKRMRMFKKVANEVGAEAKASLDADMDFFDDDTELSSREELVQEAKEVEENMTVEDRIMREPIKLLRNAVKLGMMLNGEDVSDFDNKTVKMISPRIMALTADDDPKDNNTIHLFSPNIFSLHNESSKNDVLSLSKMISSLGRESTQEWMNFVFEASGVSDAVGYMKEERAKADREEAMENFRDKNGKQKYFTKENVTQIYGVHGRRTVEHIEKLHTMFTEEQVNKLNSTGYISMTPEQLEFLYGQDSPYNDTETLNRLRNISEREQHEAIESVIHSIAKEENRFKIQRRKDVVLSPVFFGAFIADPVGVSQPIVLSPVMFTPLVISPAIFGPVILSPWSFVPVLVSPRLLCPVVLSPILFSPVILSPLAFDPVILSPGVGAPFILSPLVLSPFILSPVALTPLILCPFVLNPFILIPNVLSPIILSPFALSPLILSPPAISALILSPHALSPPILSNGFAFTAVLSPSWLS